MTSITMESKDRELAFIEVTVKGGRASFVGSSKNSCGQMQDSLIRQNKYEKALVAMWNRWHLNDMHAECEHQRKLWDLDQRITTTEYSKTVKLYSRQEKLEKLIKEKLIKGGIVFLGPLSRILLGLKWYNDVTILSIPEYFRKQYKINKQQQQYIGHVKETEHPDGILCKPCPVCGYKYGTSWLKEELPPKFETAIDFLAKKIYEEREK